MLVGAFEVHLGGIGEIGTGAKDGVPTAAGFEPDVEDVLFFAEFVFGEIGAGVEIFEEF